jgi:sulfite exporter TauE/SafE
MNCFYHPDRPAIGLCKHCQRGLCPDCASLVDDSLACKDRHESQVHALNRMTERNLLASARTGANYRRNAWFYLLTGLLFAGFGINQVRWMGLQGYFLLAVGVFLIYAGAANYLESRKFRGE